MCGPAAADGHCVVVDAVDGGGGDDVSDHDGKGQDDASYFSSYRLQHVVLAFRTVLILPVNAMDTFILRFSTKNQFFAPIQRALLWEGDSESFFSREHLRVARFCVYVGSVLVVLPTFPY